MGVGVPGLKKNQKMLFESFGKKIICACTYYLGTYPYQISSENTTICDLYEKERIKICISLNNMNPTIIVSFSHFIIFI
jgi:hypothetical protein